MVLAALLLALAAPAPEAPVIVTGRAWAPFISPMGEPFRAHSESDDTLSDWFNAADRDHDGALTSEEMQADGDRFFATLDDDHNGEIEPEELVRYEWEVAPDVQISAKTRRSPGEPAAKASERKKSDGLQGAARYGLLNLPEPVAAADSDFDRGITLDEFRQAAAARFTLLDTTRAGVLRLPALEVIRSAMIAARKVKRDEDDPDGRVAVPLPPGP